MAVFLAEKISLLSHCGSDMRDCEEMGLREKLDFPIRKAMVEHRSTWNLDHLEGNHFMRRDNMSAQWLVADRFLSMNLDKVSLEISHTSAPFGVECVFFIGRIPYKRVGPMPCIPWNPMSGRGWWCHQGARSALEPTVGLQGFAISRFRYVAYVLNISPTYQHITNISEIIEMWNFTIQDGIAGWNNPDRWLRWNLPAPKQQRCGLIGGNNLNAQQRNCVKLPVCFSHDLGKFDVEVWCQERKLMSDALKKNENLCFGSYFR